MDDDSSSTISTLITRLESYAADPTSFNVAGTSTRHPEWITDEAIRTSAASQLAEELMALQSIYADEAIHLLKVSSLVQGRSSSTSSHESSNTSAHESDPNSWLPGSKLTLSISTEIEPSSSSSQDSIPIRLAVTLPPFYPHSNRPPQLQLLSKYIGGFSVDSTLFGEILRAFYHQDESNDVLQEVFSDHEGYHTHTSASSSWIGGSMQNGVKWLPGEVILFEGIEWVKEKVLDWWTEKECVREAVAANTTATIPSTDHSPSMAAAFTDLSPSTPRRTFQGKLFTTPSIIERKSEFIGYAATLTSPDEASTILSHILSDKRVARATHPIINAWVCKTADGIVHRDCDDDGETAAGGRLAHLLSILELENVIVVVTRWYGGVHLGPDRFKLINRAAREALDLGGFVGKNADDAKQGKVMGKRNH